MRRVIAVLCAALIAVTAGAVAAATPAQASSSVIVTFVANGGTTPSPLAVRVAAGRSLASEGWSLPPTSRVGYTLTGWSTTPDGDGDPYTAMTPIKRDVVLYAQWAANAPVTVSFGSGRAAPPSPRSITVLKGQSVSDVGELPTLTRKGFVFAGWNTAANGTGDPFDASSPVFEDMWVYAQWEIADSEELANRLQARSDVTPITSHVIWRPVGSAGHARWEPVFQGEVAPPFGADDSPDVPAGAVFVVVTSADPEHAPSRNVADAEAQARLLAAGYGGHVAETVQGQAWRGPARIVASW